MGAELFDTGGDYLIWGALMLLAGCLALLVAAIAAKDPADDGRAQDDPPVIHDKPPRYDTWHWS